ncbi:DUF5930 domain-containing protein [Albidovulum sp.]
MPRRLLSRLNATLESRLPEKRLFLRSDQGTRFVRLRPATQAAIMAGSAVVFAWTIVATAILLTDFIGSSGSRAQLHREQAAFETRLQALAAERDQRAGEAAAAHQRFAVALQQVSRMQSALLESEEHRRELETGIGVIQATLKRVMTERDAARAELAGLAAAADGAPAGAAQPQASPEILATLDFISAALDRTAAERDREAKRAADARVEADRIAYDMRLLEEKHNDIFAQLEDAVTVSLEPLDKMFSAAGLDADALIAQVRRGYSGTGGPLGPLLPGASDEDDPDLGRARGILEGLDRMNLYRLAVEKTPFAMPLKTSFRYTSGFGRRWGRLHAGTDLAGAYGSPVYATADGTVIHAGWSSGYGNLVTIRHDFGIETRYGHLSAVRVQVGQKVSRGDRIGDMGSTGRSTGTHLHYEVRVSGNPVNPMTFIKAAKDVF